MDWLLHVIAPLGRVIMAKRTSPQCDRFAILWIATALYTYPHISLAQSTPEFAPPPPNPPYENVARLNIGVGFYNSGWYTCSYYYYPCNSGSYGSYLPFILGLQADIHAGGTSYLSPGLQAMTGVASASYYISEVEFVDNSANVTLWSPSLDYVAKFGNSPGESFGRFRLGAALYLGSDGGSGAVFRTGVGGSFFNKRQVGIGLDFVLEGGGYHGYWFSGIQLLASPEFRF